MKKFIVCLLLLVVCAGLQAQNLPYLKKQGTATQLIVDGKPFIMLSGELHNSSCSTLEYMKPLWANMKAKYLNTVISVVSWDQFEPVEGQYDYTLLDAQIEGARKEGLKLVVIWFASWKNGSSTYLPSWVKRDFVRFPRVIDYTGRSIDIVSTFCDETMKADAKAFRALMKRIKEVDHDNTVIMMQLENEVGVLGTPRDYHSLANEAYNSSIPKQLGDFLRKNRNNMSPELYKVWGENGYKTTGTWEEVFGKSFTNHRDWKDMSLYTEELFMAYHYARFIGYIATEGKKEHNIPMFVNAWLKGPDYPWTGRFPGGGPLWAVMDMWHCAGPDIDFLSPDIYIPQFQYIVEQYDRLGNALFIPETRGGATGASRFLWALGEHGLMGFSPFGIDRTPPTPNDPLAETYKLVEGMMDLITAHQGKPTIRGILVDDENPTQTFEMGDFIVTANINQRRMPAGFTPAASPAVPVEVSPSGGLIIQLGTEEYIVLGRGLHVRFTPKTPGRTPYVGLDRVEEGVFNNGNWTISRVLNGDEIHTSIHTFVGLRMSGMSIQKVKLYRYN